MTQCILRLIRDRIAPRAVLGALAPANRVIYVADGMATVAGETASATLAANSGWFSRHALEVAAGADGASLLRYELVRAPAAGSGVAAGGGVASQALMEAALELDRPGGYLMRCDRVDLPPGGVAYRHTHQGAGIRCLLNGGFNVEVDGKTTVIAPGEAWFETGSDPVLAWAPDDAPGEFSRVMILPRALKGKSSLRYVDPADADKPKLQRYTVFIDAFIEP